jgi:hypothetical protein
LNGKPFEEFKKYRDDWMIHDCYAVSGPIQFYGKSSEDRTKTLFLEEN